MHTLLVATNNQGKIKEFAEMFGELDVRWVTPADLALTLEVEETGTTFAENAALKATAYAEETGLLTLADDSGLEVDALGGRPGVYTARYGGTDLTPRQRYERLLAELADTPADSRSARFRCVVALATSELLLGTADGVCEGRIALSAAGESGFGYDPIFQLPELGKTMAQLSSTEKRWISHRGRAFAAIMPLLRKALLDPGMVES